MQIRILSMTAQNGGSEVLLRVELCEDVFDVAENALSLARKPTRETRELVLLLDRYTELRPARGVIDEETFLALERAAEFSEAVRIGLRMLAFGSNTRRGLENKLCRKGVAHEAAQEASLYLAQRGYIDEERDAVREAERNVAKLRGRNRIRATLYEKGYCDAAVATAERYLDGVDFVVLCKRLIARRYEKVLDDPSEYKRVAAALMRNGYTMSEIRAALHNPSV
ncbi:MAG: RecX family transcriptional regulator [Clostridia bacterium]|nr:RecX family transcriptional regulator [Clostridia bacterium]